jgi:SAM-dependent methyltransferase
MDLQVTELEATLEENHWWWVGRRRLFAELLRRADPSASARVLDVGSSTGTNLRLCRELGLGHSTGMDVSLPALQFAREKGLGPVGLGDVCALPSRSGCFDVVMATDVIEHVEDDASALSELTRTLAPGGLLLLTVPAFQALWSRHDEVSHHKRRYRRDRLVELVEGAGLQLERCFYFNFLLFVPIFVIRRLLRWLRVQHTSDAALNIGLSNRVLLWIFQRDVDIAARWSPPFGVSLLALARKPIP